MKNESKLKLVEPLLAEWLRIFNRDYNYEFVSKGIEIVITEGLRDLETQKKYLAQGKSKTLKSKHLKNKNGLSQAIDIVFQINGSINWKDMTYLSKAGIHFESHFKSKGIKATWGGDWDKDGDWKDEEFLDAYHFQLDLTPNEEPFTTSTLDFGDKGEMVRTLQTLLISKGYKLISDGDFGNKTLEAVKDFQVKNGLKDDGIVGYKTLKKLKGE